MRASLCELTPSRMLKAVQASACSTTAATEARRKTQSERSACSIPFYETRHCARQKFGTADLRPAEFWAVVAPVQDGSNPHETVASCGAVRRNRRGYRRAACCKVNVRDEVHGLAANFWRLLRLRHNKRRLRDGVQIHRPVQTDDGFHVHCARKRQTGHARAILLRAERFKLFRDTAQHACLVGRGLDVPQLQSACEK